MWDWQGQDYSLEDNTSIEIPKSLLNGVSENVDHISYVFNDETTPVKACGDLAYHVTNNEVKGKELEQYSEPSSQVKRRRMLQFESEETQESLDDAISEMSQWVAGFTEEGTSLSNNECLDPSSEGWIADCFNDAEMHFCTEDIDASGASDVQIDITELCDNPPEYDANEVKKLPVHTHQNVVFKGKKSFIRTPPRLASSVVYPFAFIKPCGVHGDVTLKDINQRIHNPRNQSQTKKILLFLIPHQHFPGNLLSGKLKSAPKVEKAALRS
ncbi:hypothetical protein DH2020_019917 [Rehmannia glutinosa]|uniref:Protein XRI1 n=1 Tax=Rehmannia glutinosa TaxID=99300 RepID=A0ABR0WEL4_REHGL